MPLELQRLDRDAPTKRIVFELAMHGAVIIENALDPPVFDRMRRELEPWFERTPLGAGAFVGAATRRFSGVFAKAPATAALAIHPAILAAIEAVLRPGTFNTDIACDCVQLNLTQAIEIEPGEIAQAPHRD